MVPPATKPRMNGLRMKSCGKPSSMRLTSSSTLQVLTAEREVQTPEVHRHQRHAGVEDGPVQSLRRAARPDAVHLDAGELLAGDARCRARRWPEEPSPQDMSCSYMPHSAKRADTERLTAGLVTLPMFAPRRRAENLCAVMNVRCQGCAGGMTRAQTSRPLWCAIGRRRQGAAPATIHPPARRRRCHA